MSADRGPIAASSADTSEAPGVTAAKSLSAAFDLPQGEVWPERLRA